MKALEQRIEELERAMPQKTGDLGLLAPDEPLTDESLKRCIGILKERARAGDADARRRLEKILFFIERAEARRHERLAQTT
jgi:hypothetical protein